MRQRVQFLILITLAWFTPSTMVQANSSSIRDIDVSQADRIAIHFDSAISKENAKLDFVRDHIQFSLAGSTIYPAKMLYSENAIFSKVFAYQYSPQLVRIRFTVSGQAADFQGKVTWAVDGNTLRIQFPKKSLTIDEKTEQRLLAKVTQSEAPIERAVENKTKATVTHASLTAPTLTSSAGKKGNYSSSMIRSFLMMGLIVGGLSLILFVIRKQVKKKKSGSGTNHGWWSKLLTKAIHKQEQLIEILAQHPLGPKQSIMVVRIQGQQLVLGVTQDHVQLITQLDADDTDGILENSAVTESIGKFLGAKTAIEPAIRTTASTFEKMVNAIEEKPATSVRDELKRKLSIPRRDFPLQ